MGRKGGGGGTAGGGVSGGKKGVSFTRVVPRFLQDLNAQAAKRAETMAREKREKGEGSKLKEKGPGGNEQGPSADEIAELEKDGFNVVQPGGRPLKAGPSALSAAGEAQRVLPRGSGKPRGASKPPQLRGAIEKKQPIGAHPSKAFRISNKQRLSFAADGSESE